MRKNKRIILLILLLASGSFLNAQRVKLIEGDLGSVRAEKTFNLEFRYDSLSVGKFHNEQDFVNKKIAERNKKHPGDGDAWAKSWVDQRKRHSNPGLLLNLKVPPERNPPPVRNIHWYSIPLLSSPASAPRAYLFIRIRSLQAKSLLWRPITGQELLPGFLWKK